MKQFFEQITDAGLNTIAVLAFFRIVYGMVNGGVLSQIAIFLEKNLCG